MERIQQFSTFPKGWHFGQGIGSTPEASDLAKQAIQEASDVGLYRVDVFPELDGSISAEFYVGEDTFDFRLFAQDHIEYTHLNADDKVIETKRMPFNEVGLQLQRISESRWSGLGFVRSKSIDQTRKGSSVTHSTPWTEGFLYLTLGVFFVSALTYVLTFESTTSPWSSQNRLPIGSLMNLGSPSRTPLSKKQASRGTTATT